MLSIWVSYADASSKSLTTSLLHSKIRSFLTRMACVYAWINSLILNVSILKRFVWCKIFEDNECNKVFGFVILYRWGCKSTNPRTTSMHKTASPVPQRTIVPILQNIDFHSLRVSSNNMWVKNGTYPGLFCRLYCISRQDKMDFKALLVRLVWLPSTEDASKQARERSHSWILCLNVVVASFSEDFHTVLIKSTILRLQPWGKGVVKQCPTCTTGVWRFGACRYFFLLRNRTEELILPIKHHHHHL